MKKHTMPQRSKEWQQKRKGVVTGTDLSALMSSRAETRQNVLYQIIAERLTVGTGPEEYENAMDRGTRLEPEAIAAFEFATGMTIEKVGFAESDMSSFIGYSPDGIVADTDEQEDIEVKCPLGKNYVKIWLTNEPTDEYRWQIVHGFVVNPKLKKRYFVAYNPDIPTHPLHIIEVTREQVQEDIDKALEKLGEFLPQVEEKMGGIVEF